MTQKMMLEAKQLLAKEAELLLKEDSLFNKIVSTLIQECMVELMEAQVGDLTATAAHARMKGLNDIKGRLRVIKNNATMAEHRAKNE